MLTPQAIPSSSPQTTEALLHRVSLTQSQCSSRHKRPIKGPSDTARVILERLCRSIQLHQFINKETLRSPMVSKMEHLQSMNSHISLSRWGTLSSHRQCSPWSSISSMRRVIWSSGRQIETHGSLSEIPWWARPSRSIARLSLALQTRLPKEDRAES